MNIKKFTFLSFCIFAIIGSTFLLKPVEKTKKFENEINYEKTILRIGTPEEYESRIKMSDFGWQSATAPVTDYKIYSDLNCVEFVYPSDITDDDDITSQMIYQATLADGTKIDIEKPSDRITFSKPYGDVYVEGSILIDISCYYKDKSTDPSAHYFEESTEQVLTELRKVGISAKSGKDFVSYTESGETYNGKAKYYEYIYISQGNSEIRARILYTGDFKEQFDLYIAEFEKTIKRK